MFQPLLQLSAVLILLCATGCSKTNPQAPAKITGIVRYNGNLVKAGNVTFHTDKGSYNTSLALDGTYSISDVPTGAVTVTVNTDFLNPEKAAPDYATAMGGGKGGPPMMKKPAGPPPSKEAEEKLNAERRAADQQAGMRPISKEEMAARFVKIPAKYTAQSSSPLKFTIEPGKQELNFDLTD